MNQLQKMKQKAENICNSSMVKIVIGGGTLLDKKNKEKIIKKNGSSLKSEWL